MPKLQALRRRPILETPRTDRGKVAVRISRPGLEAPELLPPAEISEVLPLPGVLLWVDIQDPGLADLAMLAEEFGFSDLALEDAAKQRQRPKVDEYPGHYFVVLYAPSTAGRFHELRTTEVDLFIGANYVVTLHPGIVPALEEALRRWQTTDREMFGRAGFLTHIVVDSIVDAFFPVVENIDTRLDALEDALFQGGGSADPQELLALKRSLF